MARFLALDWDNQLLHVVSATISGGAVRIQRAAAWHEQQSPNPIEAEALGQQLRERLKAAGIAPAPVLACLGRDRVILKEVRHPAVSPTEEPAIVRFQAIKELTDPVEEVIIDYTPLSEPGSGGERRAQVLIVRREMLLAYQNLCKAAGLKLLSLTPRPFGTASSLRHLLGMTVLMPAPEPPDAPVAMLTVTERWAEFCVVRGQTLLLARSLAVGPTLPGEVRRSLAVHAGQMPRQPVTALYVADCGDAGALRERLEGMLGIVVHPFDPFAGLESPGLPTTNRGAFTGAVGLLHTHADRQPLPINFAAPKQPRPPVDPHRRHVIAAAVAAGVILVGSVGFCYAKLAEKNAEQEALFIKKTDLDRQLVQLDEEEKRIKALEAWTQSGVVWLDELYDLTDRFPDPSKTQLTQFMGDPLPRTSKPDKQVAKMSLKGITTDAPPVDALINQTVLDNHYKVDPKQMSRNTSYDRFRFPQQFTTRVDVEPLLPSKYSRRLSVAAPADEGEGPRNDFPRGGFPRRQPGGRGAGPGFGFEGGEE